MAQMKPTSNTSSSGARITSLAVLTSATSRILRCVPRSTRGSASKNRGSDTRHCPFLAQ